MVPSGRTVATMRNFGARMEQMKNVLVIRADYFMIYKGLKHVDIVEDSSLKRG